MAKLTVNQTRSRKRPEISRKLDWFFRRPQVELAVGLLIVVSIVLTFVEFLYSAIDSAGSKQFLVQVQLVNDVITWFFVVELVLRFVACWSPRRYLREYWIDLVATLPSLLPGFFAARAKDNPYILHLQDMQVLLLVGAIYNLSCPKSMKDKGLMFFYAPSMLRNPNELYGMSDSWTIHPMYYVLEPDTWDVLVEHGVGSGGKYGCANTAKEKRCSYVQGHTHSNAAVIYNTNHNSTIFAMNVGCCVDSSSLAMRYGKYSTRKGVLGCGVVYSGSHAEFVPMSSWPGFKG